MDHFLVWELLTRAFFIHVIIKHARNREWLRCITYALLCELLVAQIYCVENVFFPWRPGK